MRSLLSVKVLIAAGLVVCLGVACDSSAPGKPKLALTASHAKDALVELLRKDPRAFQRQLDPNDLAKQPLTGGEAGQYRCGEFQISVPAANYKITIFYGCIFEYAGTFEIEGGRWVAAQPRWTSTGLVRKMR